MRLFIAFEASKEVSEYLKTVQKEFFKSKVQLNLTKTFHLTLKFLGEVDDKKLDDVKEAFKQIRFEPFVAKLTKLGAFPDTRNPKVLWVGLDPAEKIREFHKQVDEKLSQLFDPETKFEPHITLARVKFINHAKSFQERYEELKTEKMTFLVDKIKLIQSRPTKEGHVYEDVESVDLQ